MHACMGHVHAGPLAVVSACMMALRYEIQQRIKKKPTHEIEEALRLFQQMQVWGYTHVCVTGKILHHPIPMPSGPCHPMGKKIRCISARQNPPIAIRVTSEGEERKDSRSCCTGHQVNP